VRGGWPASLNLSIERAMQLPRQYLKAVIEDDVYRIDGVKRDTAKINLLLRSLARNESTTVSNKTIKNDIKAIDDEDIDLNTIASYLDVLNRLFLLDNLQPFSGNLRSSLRLKQMEKRRFVDPSLACALLKITPKMLFNDLNTLGFMFESLCVRDLIIYSQMFDGQVFHYQDYNSNEIDAVIEMPDGGWCAFEIKLGANQIDAAAANLLKIRDKIAEDPNGRPPKALCVISGLESAAYTRPDGVMVVPISALRE
jgi:predicted AAA+ superfamily ATPase